MPFLYLYWGVGGSMEWCLSRFTRICIDSGIWARLAGGSGSSRAGFASLVFAEESFEDSRPESLFELE